MKRKPTTLLVITFTTILFSLNACAIPLQGSSSSYDSGLIISLPPTSTALEGKKSTQTIQIEGSSAEYQDKETAPNLKATSAKTEKISPTSTPITTQSVNPYLNETSELLYISEGNLNRWDYVTGYSGLLVENVADFYASQDGKKIILLRPHKMTVNGIAIFDLDLLDFKNKQIISLVKDIPRYYNISISPNGSWLVYTSKNEGGKLYILNLEKPDQSIELGACQESEFSGCGFVSWSPDSEELVWSDAHGIWHIILNPITNKQLHSETVSLTDPKGAEIKIDVHFQDLLWSPVGRYVLTKVVPIASGVSWHGIMDTATGRLIQVPDTYDQSNNISSVLWTSDGSLLIAHAGGTLEHLIPFIKRWSVLATHDNLLIPHSEYTLNSEFLPFTISRIGDGSTACITWISQSDHPNYILNLAPDGTFASSSILSLNLEKGEISKLLDIQNYSEQILWSPDNSGALLFGPHAQIQFLILENGEILDLRTKFGSDASNFHWLPPSPRT